jgi:hypothetical protein
MFIEHEPPKRDPSSVRSGTVRACVATRGFVIFTSMPLLTELMSIKDGFSYKHGAPNGAVTTRQYPYSIGKNEELAGAA